MDLFVWTPASGTGPGILLLHEVFGVGEYIEAVADRLTSAGYVVAAPDMFWRVALGWRAAHDDQGLAASMDVVGRLDTARAGSDCVAALAHLAALPEVIGAPAVIGFCLGGTLAWSVAATGEPSCCVSYYGSRVPAMLAMAEQIDCPVLLHFGSRDPYIPGEDIEAVSAAIAGKENLTLNVEIAGHAFDNSFAPAFYDEAAARAAWSKTMAFLGSHLPVA